MGQHKHNPKAIQAKDGKLPPKEKNNMLSKKAIERMILAKHNMRKV